MLNAKYSIPSWILNSIGFATSILLLVALSDPNAPGVKEFLAALPIINPYVWSGSLLVASVVKYIGMGLDLDRWVRYGSLLAVVMWVFGIIAFSVSGNAASVVILAAPLVLFNVYLFLSVALRDKDRT
jgi:hypothetical protein